MDQKAVAFLHVSCLALDTTALMLSTQVGSWLCLGPLSTPACTLVWNFQPLCAPEAPFCYCAKPLHSHANGEASCMSLCPTGLHKGHLPCISEVLLLANDWQSSSWGGRHWLGKGGEHLLWYFIIRALKSCSRIKPGYMDEDTYPLGVVLDFAWSRKIPCIIH